MGILKGLSGITVEEVECEFFTTVNDVRYILRNGKAATTAKQNGAINIWLDDENKIRCEAMRHYKVFDQAKFNSVTAAAKWIRYSLKQIA